MKRRNLFAGLEEALRIRNPLLADRLRPGRSEGTIRKKLDRAGAKGVIEPVVALFSWKDGSDLDESIPEDLASPFPGAGRYLFMPFHFLLSDFKSFQTYPNDNWSHHNIAGRYFPLFWNGTCKYIALDLDASHESRIVLFDTEHQVDEPVWEAYSSFDQLVEDAIRANREADSLRCFTTYYPCDASKDRAEPGTGGNAF